MPSSITFSTWETLDGSKDKEREAIHAADMMQSIACLQIPVIVASGP